MRLEMKREQNQDTSESSISWWKEHGFWTKLPKGLVLTKQLHGYWGVYLTTLNLSVLIPKVGIIPTSQDYIA